MARKRRGKRQEAKAEKPEQVSPSADESADTKTPSGGVPLIAMPPEEEGEAVAVKIEEPAESVAEESTESVAEEPAGSAAEEPAESVAEEPAESADEEPAPVEEESELPPEPAKEEPSPTPPKRESAADKARARIVAKKAASAGKRLKPEQIGILVASGLLFVFSLIYLIGYLKAAKEFNLLAMGIILLMLSPALPAMVALKCGAKPGLLRVNYIYVAFIWLMQIGEVKVMTSASTWVEGFFHGLDFWILLSATAIALLTVLAEMHAKPPAKSP